MASKTKKILWVNFNDTLKLRVRLSMILSYMKDFDECSQKFVIHLNYGIQETDAVLQSCCLYYSDSTLRDNDILMLDYYFGLCQLNEN